VTWIKTVRGRSLLRPVLSGGVQLFTGGLRPNARIAQGAGTASLLMAQGRWPVAGRVRGSTRSRAWKVVTVIAEMAS
jgi:hypothetical protein